jgi:hypothetical protein
MGTCLHKRTVSGARRGPQTLGPTASEPTRIGTGTLNGARSGHHPTRVTTRTAGPKLHHSRRSVSALPSTLLGRLAAAAFSGLLNVFAVWLWIYAISDLAHANAHSIGPDAQVAQVQTFVGNHGDVAAFIDFHAYSQLWLTAWGWTDAQPPREDYALQQECAKAATDALETVHGTRSVTTLHRRLENPPSTPCTRVLLSRHVRVACCNSLASW